MFIFYHTIYVGHYALFCLTFGQILIIRYKIKTIFRNCQRKIGFFCVLYIFFAL